MQTPNIPAPAMQTLPLRDIKLPAEPSFWPLAPGWWLLIALLMMLLIWLGFKWYRHHQKKQRWQAIDEQLSAIEFKYTQDQNSQQLLTGISAFLRRFVKHQLGQNTATSLSGTQWIEHLNQLDSKPTFSPYERPLTQGPFQASCEYDADGLLQATRAFIKRQVMQPHKAGAKHV